MTESWLQRWVPGEAHRAQWRHALRPGGPVLEALGRADGIAAVTEGPNYHRTVFDTMPPLSLVTSDSDGSAQTLQPTACIDCSERSRFVRDLIEEARVRGSLRDRLVPGVELDITSTLEADSRLSGDRWPSLLALRNASDRALAQRLSRATLQGETGEVVEIRYPDGDIDTLNVQWTHGRWVILYDALAPESPLRLDRVGARNWRYISRRQDAMVQAWEPSWRAVDGGLGQIIGHDATVALLDPTDDSVWIVVQELDPAESAVFQIDTIDQAVLARHELPPRSLRGNWTAGPWRQRWRAALSDDASRLLMIGHSGVWSFDTSTGSRRTEAAFKDISAIAWGEDEAADVVSWGRRTGSLTIPRPSGSRRTVYGCTDPVGMHANGRVASTVCANGRIERWPDGDDEPTLLATACGGSVTAAAARTDGAWLVVCGQGAPHTWEVHGPLPGDPDVGGHRGVGGTLATWSPDGREVLTDALPGTGLAAVLWDVRSETPRLGFGYRAFRQASFSASGESLVTVDTNGDVVLWDVGDLRTRRAIHAHLD